MDEKDEAIASSGDAGKDTKKINEDVSSVETHCDNNSVQTNNSGDKETELGDNCVDKLDNHVEYSKKGDEDSSGKPEQHNTESDQNETSQDDCDISMGESQTFTQDIDSNIDASQTFTQQETGDNSSIDATQTYTQKEGDNSSIDGSQTFTQTDDVKDEDNVSMKTADDDEKPADDDKKTADDENQKDHDQEQTDKDETGKPEFETAPDAAEETAEDHTKDLDPFDALLKETPTESNTTSKADQFINAADDDDNDNTDDVIQHDDDEDAALEEAAEPTEEPGGDEEVILIPDTEREISEADKAEAEKVLAEKRRIAEELEANAVPKEETTEEPEADVGDTETAEADAEAAGDGHENDKEEHEEETVESAVPNDILEISPFDANCIQCYEDKPCSYRFKENDTEKYICTGTCLTAFQEAHPGQYTVIDKKYLIEEIAPKDLTCSECEEEKTCYFYYNFDGEDTHYCSLNCLHSMMGDEKDKYTYKRRKLTITEIAPVQEECMFCNEKLQCAYNLLRYGETKHICDVVIKHKEDCTNEFGRYLVKKIRVSRKQVQVAPPKPPLLKLKVISNATDKYLDDKLQARTPAMIQAAREERERTFIRRCQQCSLTLKNDDKNLTWETMEFCNETCLSLYQNKIGGSCANCKNTVTNTSLGKYCVRFGNDIRQFCNSGCLEEFKKGLKICCYCQRDISGGHEGFLAPVGDKKTFKDFCSQKCMEKFDQMTKNASPPAVWAKCAVCSLEKSTTIEVEVGKNTTQRLCSDPCFAAFKFVNNIFPDQCQWCKKYFERRANKCFTIYDGASPLCFCSKPCINVYISNNRHIVPCNWCKVKKYNFDMIKRNLSNIMMCSLNCLNLYQVSINAVSSRRIKCDMCKRSSIAQYHLTMSDATVRNFCTYACVMAFQGQYSKAAPLLSGEVAQQPAVPTGAPRRTITVKNSASKQQTGQRGLPVISSVQSLASPPPLTPAPPRAKSKRPAKVPSPPPAPPGPPSPPPRPATPPPPPPPKIYNHVLVKTLPPPVVANKGTMSKPMMVSKGISCRPHPCTKECQTDPSLERRILIPVPVPIYVPVPCVMWSIPFPIPVPIPIPVPTPVFIPTTRNSAKGIMKEISKIHDKMPTDPFEAELLMMAEMVAGDKKKDQTDSDTDDENNDTGFSPVGGMDGPNAFGEDVLQMALKMASEYEDQPVDLESAMTANTITPSSHPGMPGLEGESLHHHHMMVLEQQRAVAALRAVGPRGKRAPPAPAAAPAPAPPRRGKRRRQDPPQQPDPPREPLEKPDANMCLKYTFGVNAWKQWVMTKNAEIEKSSTRRKPFKSEILQLTADELNYSLCLFVKEVRKPNGSEYAPDTIYYLVLGIQQYLFENGRIDNIFTDPYYEKFTDCLDEVARKFSVLYNDSQYIVTRVEEEHLWESKQLGAHSPHVLLSTLMFFNTKHFNLVTVDEHMQLSFSHIMKHWKRNPNQPGQAKIPGSRNVLLRFYPPQSALEANSRKKKVYEQQENEENPLRCPVKLYEFYISKCPESVRTRNDVFYLQPERSCVPDSPVWYSTQPLSRDALAKMLHRVKMVKEINIALLTS